MRSKFEVQFFCLLRSVSHFRFVFSFSLSRLLQFINYAASIAGFCFSNFAHHRNRATYLAPAGEKDAEERNAPRKEEEEGTMSSSSASSPTPSELLLPATALVVARGPDARHSRGLGCPLAVTEGGTTTVTCSGVLLPSFSSSSNGFARVLVPASAVAPFVDEEVKNSSSLVGGTTLSVSFPSCSCCCCCSCSSSFRVAAWLKLAGADAALSRLSREGWETGWSLSLSISSSSTMTFSTATSTTSSASPASAAAAAASPSSSSASLLLSAPARPPPPSAAWLAVIEGQRPVPAEAAYAAALLWGTLTDDGGDESSPVPLPPPPPPGTPLLAAGAPLGGLSAPHFAGCVLSGAVSAVVRDGCSGQEFPPPPPPPLFLADLPSALPGADGGPVVAVSATGTGRFVGVLAPPLRQRHHRRHHSSASAAAAAPSGLPLVVAAGPLARALREARLLESRSPQPPSRPQPMHSSSPPPPPPPPPSLLPFPPSPPPLVAASAASSPLVPNGAAALEIASRSVVALLVPGSSWATAVHVGGGVFLTAGHALPSSSSRSSSSSPPPPSSCPPPPPPRVLLQLRSPSGAPEWEPAEVDGRPLPALASGLDVAVVRLSQIQSSEGERSGRRRRRLPPAAEFAPSTPAASTPVAVLGFPRLHPRVGLGPLATFGVVSRTLAAAAAAAAGKGRGSGEEEMMLTSSSVLAGASGGAVVDLSSPASPVVGLVVSNTRHLESGRTLAHLNYSVCGDALRACWEHARELAGEEEAGEGDGGEEEAGEREERGERSESGGGGVFHSERRPRQRRQRQQTKPAPPPLPPIPTPEARAALWALAAVPRRRRNGAEEEEDGGGPPGSESRREGGRAALDRLLERAGIRNGDSSSSPPLPAPAAADWSSRM